jgi:hypothetical protein
LDLVQLASDLIVHVSLFFLEQGYHLGDVDLIHFLYDLDSVGWFSWFWLNLILLGGAFELDFDIVFFVGYCGWFFLNFGC